MHPVEHDLRGSAVSGGDVARHDLSLCSSQSEVQQLDLVVCTDTNVAWLYVLCSAEMRERDEKMLQPHSQTPILFKHRNVIIIFF